MFRFRVEGLRFEVRVYGIGSTGCPWPDKASLPSLRRATASALGRGACGAGGTGYVCPRGSYLLGVGACGEWTCAKGSRRECGGDPRAVRPTGAGAVGGERLKALGWTRWMKHSQLEGVKRSWTAPNLDMMGLTEERLHVQPAKLSLLLDESIPRGLCGRFGGCGCPFASAGAARFELCPRLGPVPPLAEPAKPQHRRSGLRVRLKGTRLSRAWLLGGNWVKISLTEIVFGRFGSQVTDLVTT